MGNRQGRTSIKQLRAHLTSEQIAAALRAANGNVSEAARQLGAGRATLYEHMQNDPTLMTILTDAREALVDSAESALSKLINEGNVAAVIFALKTQGKKRGWVERQEITGADGDGLTVNVVYAKPNTDIDTP